MTLQYVFTHAVSDLCCVTVEAGQGRFSDFYATHTHKRTHTHTHTLGLKDNVVF